MRWKDNTLSQCVTQSSTVFRPLQIMSPLIALQVGYMRAVGGAWWLQVIISTTPPSMTLGRLTQVHVGPELGRLT